MAPKGLVGGFAVGVNSRQAELLHLKLSDELVVEYVTKWSVSKVMAETSDSDIADLGGCHFKLRLVLGQQFHLLARQVTCSNAVLSALVGATREHLVAEPQLLESLKPLELRGVDNIPVDWFQRANAVDWVVDLSQQRLRLRQLDITCELLRTNHFCIMSK